MPAPLYRPLPYKGRIQMGMLMPGNSSLWEAPDHMLCRNRYGFLISISEEYKRFYYADVRAVSLTATSGRAVRNGFLFFFALALAVLAAWEIAGHHGARWAIVTLVPALILAGCGIVNTRKGRFCRVSVHTGVQKVDLPVFREAKARRFIAELKSRIAPIQGELGQEEILERSSRNLPPPPPVAGPESSYRGEWHLVLAGFLMVGIACDAVILFHGGMAPFLTGQLISSIATVASIVCLARQAHRPFPAGMKRFALLAAIWMGLLYCLGIVLVARNAIQAPALNRDLPAMMIYMGHLSAAKDHFYFWSVACTSIGSFLLGVAGLFATLSFRRGLRG